VALRELLIVSLPLGDFLPQLCVLHSQHVEMLLKVIIFVVHHDGYFMRGILRTWLLVGGRLFKDNSRMLHCCVEAGLDTCTSLLQTMNRVIAPRALGQELRHVLGISGATSGLASIPTLGD
jgi:hypothetical protein